MERNCDTCNTRYVCEGEYEFNCKQAGYGGYSEDTRDTRKDIINSTNDDFI